MKPYLPILLLSLAVLSSCDDQKKSESSEAKQPIKTKSNTAANHQINASKHGVGQPQTGQSATLAPPVQSQPDRPSSETTENAMKNLWLAEPNAEHADQALQTLKEGEEKQAFMVSLITNWAMNQPQASADWLASKEEFPGKALAVHNTVDMWQRMNFAASTRWIETLPKGASRQSALRALATHIRSRPDELDRQRQLQAIQNLQLRQEIQGMLPASQP